jgi:hypothetical protein
MSAAFFIVLDREDPGFDTTVNGKFLSQDAKRLGKVAELLGIRSLEEYVSYSPEEARAMMEEMGTDPDEIEGLELPEQKWYDPQEGLDWVSQVCQHIQANPSHVKNAKGVLEDLEQYRGVLEQAKAVGARWNLQVDF